MHWRIRLELTQFPDAAGISGEQPGLFIVTAAGKQGMRRGDPGRKASAERADGPVAAPDETIPPETLYDMMNVRLQRFKAPGLRIRIGDDAGNLGGDIRAPGDVGDLAAPLLKTVGLDVRNAAVIKDELDVLCEIDQCDRLVYLPWQYT
jgi:hypothetical protein